MNTFIHSNNQLYQKKFTTLKKTVDKERAAALKKRLKEEPYMTDLEYLLGAFLEMYEPHLKEIVCKLSERGYAIETSSGFGQNNPECQSLNGYFAIDYITRNKLEKAGIKVREHNGFKSLVFLADRADLDYIKQKWLQIIDVLPDRGVLASPSASSEAIKFRRKYNSKNPQLQRQRLFERLEYNIQTTMKNDIKRRIKRNSNPNKMESCLGIFIEELEPQVRQAVIEMNRKGYATDLSGFVNNSCEQMIEGDFQLGEKVINKLNLLGITVEKNPSGYTRLQFSPKEADINKIKRHWNKVVSLLPNRNRIADSSMTRKSREFRTTYEFSDSVKK